jgi:hypothetical protein
MIYSTLQPKVNMLICLLICPALGSISWGQAISSKTPLETGTPITGSNTDPSDASDHSQKTETSNGVAAVITINGLCDVSPSDKTKATSCKTLITQSQFEKVINAIQPDMPARARREFALRYAKALVMTKMAEEMGLDAGPIYEEQMKLARIQILTKELNKAIETKVSQISHQDIEDYYNSNRANFETVEMDRIYVPTSRQAITVSDKALSDADREDRSRESEQIMREEANVLHGRAVAGEEFATLEADAYKVAGIKAATVNTSITIRRTSLPANQVSVMALNPGQVSSILTDPRGYVIYKVKTKTVMPLDQVQEEIKATLRTQRLRSELNDIEDDATPVLDEIYFQPKRSQQRMTRASEPAKSGSMPYSGKPQE